MPIAAPPEVVRLRKRVRDGSAYAAFQLARQIHAECLGDVLDAVEGAAGPVFDAVADGYRVWEDARDRGML